MIPLSPALLTTTACALVEVARTVNGTQRLVELFLQSVGRPDLTRWNAAFIHYAGYWSHYDHCTERSRWPLPATAECSALAEFALARGVLSARPPEPGEVFLLWSLAEKRFVHSGIVLKARRCLPNRWEPHRYDCHTIEGNVTVTGRVGGECLAPVRRLLSPGLGDRTIRWAAAEERLPIRGRLAA